MEPYKNLFKEKSEVELYFLYQQFLKSEETGSIPDNGLKQIRDEYCNRAPNGNGVLMMILDLTRAICRSLVCSSESNLPKTTYRYKSMHSLRFSDR